MPELPEVEFARGCIERWLKGKPLARVEADRTRVVRGSSPAAIEELAGHKLQRVERRGKWLLWQFDHDRGVLAHLGMTGKYVLQKPKDGPVSHSRVRFVRQDGAVLHYQDPRMFGRVAAGPIAALRSDPGFHALGPDAWDDPPTATQLCEVLHSRKRAVKEVLMDQTVLAGVGNIQATEALFHARVHPARGGASLSPEECRRIAAGIHWSLARTLKMNKGDKIIYVEEPGEHENPFLIYGKEGEPCPNCGTPIKATESGGRTSAFCPHCQPRGGSARSRRAPRAR
jgi:formamidopyrimidine-DNA glycosylase